MTPAPTGRTYRRLLVGLALVGLAADQATKYGMFARLYHDGQTRGERDVVPGWFRFTAEFTAKPTAEFTAESDRDSDPAPGGLLRTLQLQSAPVMPRVNHGALFGLGGGHKADANQGFAVVSALAAAGILAWGLRRSTAGDRWLSGALGLILGGTVGNLYDRVVFGGVRDFLYFYRIEWPVFNVADCCLVAGAGVLLAHAFLTPSKAAEKPAEAPAAVTA